MSTDMERLEVGRRMLAAVLGCPVSLVDDPAPFAERFAVDSSFDAALQPMLTAARLSDAIARLDPRTVHELRDPLEVSLTIFRLDERRAVVVGPYTSRSLAPGEAEAILGRLRMPSARLQAYRLYRARFPIVDSEYVMRGASALFELVGVPVSEVAFRSTTSTAGPVAPGSDERPHSATYDAIDERYEIEREFMRCVAEGDERRALAQLRRMAGLPRTPGYLTIPYLGPTILRIMSRVAAQQGGLPPVTIDAISQTYAQRLHRTGLSPHSDQQLRDVEAMVVEFCRQVRRYRQRPYSRLVRQVLDELELHLSTPVSTSDLAERLHLSESHLARRFKTETGHTISEHLAAERAARAADLLATTDQPVRDIAAYVGYLDANYFVKVFRGEYGVTPTEYRRRHAL